MANEKRLIDANVTADTFTKWLTSTYDGRMPCDIVAEIPTVDAVEVVHGEWFVIEDDYFDLVELKCSACGESFGFEDYEDCMPQNYHYCPNCGAKMDGDGNA